MQLQRSLVVDSALMVSLGSALCFFFGGAYEQGTAAGLGLPAEFVARDLWRTVAAGFDAVLASIIFLPVGVVGDDGVRWKVAALLAWVVVVFFLHIYTTAANNIQDWARRSEKCLLGEGCPAARVPHKVTYVLPDGEKREGMGMFLSMNPKYLIMYSSGGLLIVPVDSIREIVTAVHRQPP